MNETSDAAAVSATAEILSRIEARLSRIEGTLARFEEAADSAPALAAIAVDAFDESCRGAKTRGVDVDARLGAVGRLVARLSEPGTIQALERLIDGLPALDQLLQRLDEAPGLFAMLTDAFDEWAAGLVAQGIDPQKSLRQGIHAALWLGERVSETELERLGILLRSDVIDPHALAVVGKTGRALATCHEGSCERPVPSRLGPVGALRALFDPDVQSTLSFAVQVARCFGSHLPDPADIPGLAGSRDVSKGRNTRS